MARAAPCASFHGRPGENEATSIRGFADHRFLTICVRRMQRTFRLSSLVRLSAVCAAAACAGFARAQPAGSPIAPSLENPNRYAVTGIPAARAFLRLAATRRVDMAIIGDSNTRQLEITGHEDGMGRAFAARFGMYAT